eukprot:TRINITY_DN9001_c0_g4_i2.p1 TRINITY_DN9001_c0_g4~~TRINITY_DN9001_c0_g4_i2.p1  ORF type:complete len:383 (+),score=31.23 TRINITY_DN9001_c0_g4_i2:454-1602(+)
MEAFLCRMPSLVNDTQIPHHCAADWFVAKQYDSVYGGNWVATPYTTASAVLDISLALLLVALQPLGSRTRLRATVFSAIFAMETPLVYSVMAAPLLCVWLCLWVVISSRLSSSRWRRLVRVVLIAASTATWFHMNTTVAMILWLSVSLVCTRLIWYTIWRIRKKTGSLPKANYNVFFFVPPMFLVPTMCWNGLLAYLDPAEPRLEIDIPMIFLMLTALFLYLRNLMIIPNTDAVVDQLDDITEHVASISEQQGGEPVRNRLDDAMHPRSFVSVLLTHVDTESNFDEFVVYWLPLFACFAMAVMVILPHYHVLGNWALFVQLGILLYVLLSGHLYLIRKTNPNRRELRHISIEDLMRGFCKMKQRFCKMKQRCAAKKRSPLSL